MVTVAGRGERARKTATQASSDATARPSDVEIRVLAYHLYERRCESGTPGDAAGDWIEAEGLLSKRARAASSDGD